MCIAVELLGKRCWLMNMGDQLSFRTAWVGHAPALRRELSPPAGRVGPVDRSVCYESNTVIDQRILVAQQITVNRTGVVAPRLPDLSQISVEPSHPSSTSLTEERYALLRRA